MQYLVIGAVLLFVMLVAGIWQIARAQITMSESMRRAADAHQLLATEVRNLCSQLGQSGAHPHHE